MIDIRIENAGKFQDIALLVDQDKFIDHVAALRKILQICLDPNNFEKYSLTMPFAVSTYKNRLHLGKNYPLTQNQLNHFRMWFANDGIFDYLQKNHTPYFFTQALRDASIRLLTNFKQSDNFLQAIQAAIAINVVREEDYETVILSDYSLNIADTSKLPKPDREIYKIPQEGIWKALFFQKNTTRQEIDKVLDKEFSKIPDEKTKPAIKIHREWYRLIKEERLSLKQIADISIYNDFDESTISKGIKNYKKLLQKKLQIIEM